MYNSPSSFQISQDNIVQGKRRSIGSVIAERLKNTLNDSASNLPSEELEEVEEVVDDMGDRIVTVVGDLACYKDELSDHLASQLENLRSLSEFDELRKEIRTLKANILKSSTILKQLKPDEDTTECTTLIQKSKDFLAKLDVERLKFVDGQTKQQDDRVFSHISVLKSSLDTMIATCKLKLKVDLAKVDDGELTMLSDNISSIRDEYSNVNRLYFEFVEKCPHNYPDKEDLFPAYDTSLKDLEKKKTDYEAGIIKEMQRRELTRNKIQDIKNEIKLPHFQGYGSELDFYTFKSRFLNKYRRDTSRDMFDILKNSYLKGEAYNTVKELSTLEQVWDRLKKDFGNPAKMLKDKLGEIVGIGSYARFKGIPAKSEAVLKTINLLSDIFKLADEHDLHLDLYCKNEKVLGQMLKQLPRLWLHDWQALKKNSKSNITEQLINSPAWKEDQLHWELFKKFLEDQLTNLKDEEAIEDSLREVVIEEDKTKVSKTPSKSSHPADIKGAESLDYYDYEDFSDDVTSHTHQTNTGLPCKLCNSSQHKHYWDCQVFMKCKHGDRFEHFVNPRKNSNPKPHVGKLLGECAACLVPNAKFGHNCHEAEAVKRWLCPSAHKKPVHILCCRHHIDTNNNIWDDFHYNIKLGFLQGDELVPEWKRTIEWKVNHTNPILGATILEQEDTPENADANTHTSSAAQNVSPQISHKSLTESSDSEKSIIIEKPVKDEAIFLFQEITVDGNVYNVFYDLGCGDFWVGKGILGELGRRATLLCTGSCFLIGAGNVVTEMKHGVYQVQLPLANGNDALFAGLCGRVALFLYNVPSVMIFFKLEVYFITQGW